jgi:leucyl/phenylalanyl-tRNA---protein transferase
MARVVDAPRFPPAESADEYGIVLVGGKLRTDWITAAYRRGIFPWPISAGRRSVLAWFSPDPRALIEHENLHISRRLARRLRSGHFQITFDQAFEQVIACCAAPRDDDDGEASGGTWIIPELAHAYCELHTLGIAHSVEVWQQGELVGGLYGVAFGGYFSGESMFHRVTDASKIALVSMSRHLQRQGFSMFDVQLLTSHLASLGATEISRAHYLQRLSQALTQRVTFYSSHDSPLA